MTLLEFTVESPFLELFTSWLAHSWTPAKLSDRPKEARGLDQVPSRTFLAEHPDLDPLLGEYLNTCSETPFSFFEIIKREVGQRLICRDLICGVQHVLIEGLAATLLRGHQILYARIVEVDGVAIIDAVAPWPIAEDLTSAILALRQDILERPFGSAAPAHARERLLARELDVRCFYWGVIVTMLKEGSLGPQVRFTQSLHKPAERLLMVLAPSRTAAENRVESGWLLAAPEIRQQAATVFTGLYESWVNERLAVLGNKTPLEAVATPEGKVAVAALLAEIESDFALLPFSLDPQVLRRVRERLGMFPTERLN